MLGNWKFTKQKLEWNIYFVFQVSK